MAKALLMAIGVLMIVVFASWYFGSPMNPVLGPNAATSTNAAGMTNDATQVSAEPSQKAAPKAPAQTAPKSLLTQKGSYECDYTQVTGSGQSSNVIYMYGGKLRAEFRTRNADGTVTANLLVYDGRYVYEWREGTSSGTRSVLTSLSKLPLIIPKNLTSGQIIGDNFESVGWRCHTWLTNKSLLTPPSYVTFN